MPVRKIVKHSLFLLVTLLAGFEGFCQPANDDPCNAIVLTPAATCTFVTYTNAAATGTTGVADPSCASYLGGDVWFQVVVPAGGALTFDSRQGVMTDGGMAVYSGTCDALTVLACDDDNSDNGLMPRLTVGGQTPGSTLWVRFWEYRNDNNGTFGICVTIPPPPPANDNPCDAIPLTPASTCTYQTFTNANATGSVGVPAPGCASYSGGDVWFQAVVPAGGALVFSTQSGIVTDGGMAVYSGTCSALTLISCNDDAIGNMPRIVANGLTPGSTVWVRFWEYGNNGNGTFGICVTIPPPPPANDDPCTAIQLTVRPVCNYTTFTNESATNTIGAPAPGCAGYTGGDVWFKIVVPSTGSVRIETAPGVMTDGGMAAYGGPSCSALTLIACNDNAGNGSNMPALLLRQLTPGDTVWIRVWENGNNNNGTFGICVSSVPPPGPGEICSLANPFCSSNSYIFPNITGQLNPNGNGIYGCLQTIPNPVWYYMQVQSAGSININITQRACSTIPGVPGELIDVDFVLWGPFTSLATGCTGIAASNIVDCSYSLAGTETANIANAQVGQFYIMLVTNFENDPGQISFQATGTGNTGSTDCSIVSSCNLQAYNSGPVCTGDSLYLSASNIACGAYQWTGPNGFTSTLQNPRLVAPANPGIYTFTVTGSVPGLGDLGCIDTTNVYVGEKPELGPDTTINKCAVEEINLDVFYSYNRLPYTWYFGGSPVANPTAVTASGVYTLIVTNEIGCQDSAKVTLNAEAAPNLGADTTVLACGGASFNLTTVINTGTFATQWTFGGGPVPDPTNVVTNGVYELIATNIAGCADTVLITLNAGPKPALGNDTSVLACAGTSVNLTTIISTTILTTEWSFGGGVVPDPTNVTAPGVYQLIGTNSTGCKDTLLVTIVTGPKPSLGADATGFFCDGFSFDLTTVYNTTGLTTSWTLAGGPVPQPSAVAVAGIYQLIATNTSGCSDTALVTVRANTLAATVTAVNASCASPTGVITVTPVNGTSPFEYSINNGTTFGAGNIFNPAATATAYAVIVRDADGCKDTVTATIAFINDLTLQSRTDTTICGNESVQMTTVSNGASFAWTPSTGLSSSVIASPVASPTVTTSYIVTATTGPCTASDTVTITVFPLPTVNAGADITVIRGDDAPLFSIVTNAISILWSPATYLNNATIANPVAVRPDQTTQYRVTATNAVGCSSFDDVLVTVLPYCVKVKNAFTPNGDGVNDNWMVYDDFNCLKNIRVQVFNRYGSKVFESTNYRNNWTGTYSGKSLPDATYYYVIDYTLITNKVVQLRGDVTILR